MSHIRKQIRYALRDLLITIPGIGSNVFLNRVDPIEKNKIPAITVHVDEDELDSYTPLLQGGVVFNRNIPIAITLYQDGESVDDDLDDLAELVEQKIAEDNTLGGLITSIRYQATELKAERAEKMKGAARITFICNTPPETI